MTAVSTRRCSGVGTGTDRWTNVAAALRHYGVKVSKALRLIGMPDN